MDKRTRGKLNALDPEQRRAKDNEAGQRRRDRLSVEERREQRYQGRLLSMSDIEFVAIDGEGWDVAGRHSYTLLGASTGDVLSAGTLSAEACFQWLLDLRERNPGAVFVGYAIDYDVTMMVQRLNRKVLERLSQELPTRWQGFHGTYTLTWISHKSFSIVCRHTDGRQRSILIWDVFGYFQQSFLKALSDWRVGSPEEQAFIAEMKTRRGDFEVTRRDVIAEYNAIECRLLVELMNRLRDALQTAGIRPSRWDGAGSIASALLRRYQVAIHLAPPPEAMETAIMSAYYGGRTQILRAGHIPGPIWHYDLNSAYTSAIRHLPSLVGGFVEVPPDGPILPNTLYEVEWRIPYARNFPYFPVAPFPWRSKERIEYPWSGRGYYWSPLVAVALAHYPPETIRLRRAWSVLDTGGLPFAWVEELYDQRRRFKAVGNAAEKPLKLGLNSLYGKMAQGLGWRGKRPAYQSYVWAGLITASIQARLLAAGLQEPLHTLFFATDGIYTTSPLDLPCGAKLGEWEAEKRRILRMELYQPGLYRVLYADGGIERSRGFAPSEIDWEVLACGWQERNLDHVERVEAVRFMTLKQSVHRGALQSLGQWRPVVRELELRPGGIVDPIWPGMDPVGAAQGDQCWLSYLFETAGRYPRPFEPRGGSWEENDVKRETVNPRRVEER